MAKYILKYISGFLFTLIFPCVLLAGLGCVVAGIAVFDATVLLDKDPARSFGDLLYVVYVFGLTGVGLGLLVWLLVGKKELQELKRSRQAFHWRSGSYAMVVYDQQKKLSKIFVDYEWAKFFKATVKNFVAIFLWGIAGALFLGIIGLILCLIITDSQDIRSKEYLVFICVGGSLGFAGGCSLVISTAVLFEAVKKVLMTMKYVLLYISGLLITLVLTSVPGAGLGFALDACIAATDDSQSSLYDSLQFVGLGFVSGFFGLVWWLLVGWKELWGFKRNEGTFLIRAKSKYEKVRPPSPWSLKGFYYVDWKKFFRLAIEDFRSNFVSGILFGFWTGLVVTIALRSALLSCIGGAIGFYYGWSSNERSIAEQLEREQLEKHRLEKERKERKELQSKKAQEERRKKAQEERRKKEQEERRKKEKLANLQLQKILKDLEKDLDLITKWNKRFVVTIDDAIKTLTEISKEKRKRIHEHAPSSESIRRIMDAPDSRKTRRVLSETIKTTEAKFSPKVHSEFQKTIDKEIDDVNQIIRDLKKFFSWETKLTRTLISHQKKLRWISQEEREAVRSSTPRSDVLDRIMNSSYSSPTNSTMIKARNALAKVCLDFDDNKNKSPHDFIRRHRLTEYGVLRKKVDERIENTNKKILETELRERKKFLDTIEKSPLTKEQATSVICYDNHVQVVAAAGSGKTSVMVARAAYAIDKKFVKPSEVLLLAFNKAAAKELQERVNERLSAAGIPSEGIRVETFHALGGKIIAEGTDRKRRVPSWLEPDDGVKEINKIITDLCKDKKYEKNFENFRLLMGQPPETSPDEVKFDSWKKGEDGSKGRQLLKTADGNLVKSRGEKMIADWLFYRWVEYEYERPYLVDTADSQHSQYHPDFYYPKIDSWHEHWGLDKNGKPPPKWKGYLDSKKWKSDLHRKHSSNPLIETTWHQIVRRGNFNELEKELLSRGLKLKPDFKRKAVNEPLVSHEDMAGLIRTFMRHVKSNSITKENFGSRADHDPRTQKFMKIYWPIHEEWNNRLKENYIDFEDMLVRAAEILETTDYDPGYKLVLVDEFQDSSIARVRMISGLLKKSNRHLLAVGDDWQSINRFAGADISAMTNFGSHFGEYLQFQLTKTFRCPQDISDAASKFIMKNPKQIKKNVVSSHGASSDRSIKFIKASQLGNKSTDEPVNPFQVSIETELLRIEKEITNKTTGRPTVFILGRYKFDEEVVPKKIPKGLNVKFMTIHKSKGLEADYVIIPNLKRENKLGFPSGMVDDPVLESVMPVEEDFENAEERRLFYVAMTRARKELILVIPGYEKISKFLVELFDQENRNNEGLSRVTTCPHCKEGVLVKREGEHGAFYGCSTFPACIETSSI